MKEPRDLSIWKSHMAKASEYGSIPKYCIEAGISKSAFYYNRARIVDAQVGPRVTGVKKLVSQFLPIRVSETLSVPTKELPEAKWVAEFLIYFLGGKK